MKVVVVSEADPGCVGPEVYTIWGTLFLKNNTKLRIRIKYECEYLFGATPMFLGGARPSEGHFH